MLLIRLIPVILTALLFSAHLLRHNGPVLALPVLILLFLLFVRRPWAIRMWQGITGLAVVEWVRITIIFIQMRLALEQSYGRLLVIMTVVILFNIFTIIWLENKKIKAAYHFNA